MILSVDGIEFGYGNEPILRDIRFQVGTGEFLAILGNNGAGKSTLLKCLNRVLKPQRGTVMLDEGDVAGLSRVQLARRLGYVPQKTEATTRMTVFDAVLLGRKPHIGWDAGKRDFKIVERVLGQLGLDDLAMRFLDELSGGELQKTAIARALAQEPSMLLLDEPTSSLDLRNQLEVLGMIKRVAADTGVAVVAVMHDINLALRYADRFLFLSSGRVHSCGGPEVITSDNIASVYGVAVSVTQMNDLPHVVPL